MRRSFQISILMTLAWQGVGKSRPVIVDVYLNDRDDSSTLLGPGTSVASGIFSQIGIRVRWHEGEAPDDPGQGAALQSAFGIRTVEHAPLSASRGALASSELNGSSVTVITVYKDAVQTFLDWHPTLHKAAPGYILAHELAHMMQGLARHSTIGILAARWSGHDCQNMMSQVLAFTPKDVELIHQGLARRLAATGAPIVEQRENGNQAAVSSTKR